MSKVRLHFIGTLIFSVSSLCYGQETIPLPGVVAEEERRDSEVELFTSPYVYTESPNGLLEEPAGGLLAEPLPLDATSEESALHYRQPFGIRNAVPRGVEGV